MMLPASYHTGFAPRDGYPAYPELWRGCVGAWAPCIGPTGLTLRDWSGRQNHGTLTNFTPGTAWGQSQGRHSLTFDGVDDFLSIAHGSQFSTLSSAGTVSFWFRTTTSGAFQDIVSKPSFNGFEFRIRTDNKLQLLRDGSTNVIGSATIATNTWYAMSITFSSSASIGYLNGAVDFNGAFTIVDNTSDFNFGRRLQFGDFYFAGQIEAIMIHNRVLSQNEIRTLATRRGIAYEMYQPTYYVPQVTSARRRKILTGQV